MTTAWGAHAQFQSALASRKDCTYDNMICCQFALSAQTYALVLGLKIGSAHYYPKPPTLGHCYVKDPKLFSHGMLQVPTPEKPSNGCLRVANIYRPSSIHF